MSPKQTVFFSFLAGALGAFIVVLLIQKFQHVEHALSQNLQPVSEIQQLDTKKDSIVPTKKEKTSIAEKEKDSSVDDKSDDEEAATTVTKTIVSPPTIGKLSPLGPIGKNMKASQTGNAKFLTIAGKAFSSGSKEETFGFESNAIDNAKDYLKKKVCLTPSFTMVSEEKRNQSKFFDAAKENTYRGNTSIFQTEQKKPDQKFDALFQFNSPSYENFDYIEIKNNEYIMEKRVIHPEISSAAWRFNACSSAISLLSERCPWNDLYTYEYKDLFVSPDSKKLIGNVYCKKISDTNWTHVGNFELNQAAE